MSKMKKNRHIKPAAAAWGEGDGIPAKEDKKIRLDRDVHDKHEYSALRLAGRIREILNLEIPESGNPLLSGFVVGSVLPSGGGNFIAQVYSTVPGAVYDPATIKAILDAMKPELRAEVAHEVTRKKAPYFKFEVLPPGMQPLD